MVKITGPFQSSSARGTIANAITYRRHATGTVATRKPRHPKPIPPALLLNTIFLPRLRLTLRTAGVEGEPTWDTLAKASQITRMQAALRFNLPRVKDNRYIQPWYDAPETEPYPPEPVIHFRIAEGVAPQIYADLDVDDWDYLVLYGSNWESDEPSQSTVRTMLRRVGKYSTFDLTYDDGHPWFWRAVAWYVGSGGTPTSIAYNPGLPPE